MARDIGDDPEIEIIGAHPEMQKIARLVTELARTTDPVLITGEVGSGQGLIARAIHHRGPRSDKPFVHVELGAIPEALVAYELFGHEKVGALQHKLGRFELAQGGTLFLDEIGVLLRREVQAKLLRVLQKHEIMRLGGTRAIKIDVRIITADHILDGNGGDLKTMVEMGNFREDLYHELNVAPIPVPPLRERVEDMPLLLDYFVRRYNDEFKKQVQGFTPEALSLLTSYSWPGNVRELRWVVESTVALVDGPRVGPADLPRACRRALGPCPGIGGKTLRMKLKHASNRLERIIVYRAMEEAVGNVSKAARILGLDRNTLVKRLSKLYKLAREEPDRARRD